MEELKYVERKKNFFKKITGEKFSTVIKNLGFPEFYEEWEYIREIRNKLIHRGNPFIIDERHIEKAWEITLKSIEVFVKLNNKFCIKELTENDKK